MNGPTKATGRLIIVMLTGWTLGLGLVRLVAARRAGEGGITGNLADATNAVI